MMEPLFKDIFPTADKSAWLAQVRKELKEENAYETLRWHTDDGFVAEPYYTAEDLAALPLTEIQSAQKQTTGWINAPDYPINNEKTSNLVLRDALARGADALVLTLSDHSNLSRLLNGIKLSDTPIFFRLAHGADVLSFVESLKTVAPYQLKGGLLTDAGQVTTQITRLTADSPQFRTVCVGSHEFHNAGATATQELAFSLARLTDVYDRLTEEGLSVDELVPKTILSVSVGTSYFPEIAKLRALRVLLMRFLSAYSILPTPFYLHCQTSTFYEATATPYTNLLRATTEAMAAVVGGCDALTIHPYNTVLGTSNEFSERIARNVSVLLKEESYFDKVTDPSAGSYYIETLTSQLIESAWNLFLRVEEQGGLTQALKANFVQNEIEQAFQAKVKAVRDGKVLVGVTKFRFDETTNQRLPDNLKQANESVLPDRRLSEEFE